MLSLTELVVMALAAHRLWVIWFDSSLAAPMRLWMRQRGGKLADLANCPLCVSVWMGAAATALWLVPYGYYIDVALATSALIFGWNEVYARMRQTNALLQQRIVGGRD